MEIRHPDIRFSHADPGHPGGMHGRVPGKKGDYRTKAR